MRDPRRAARLLLVTVTALVTALGVQGTAAAAPQSGSTPTQTPAPAVASPSPSATPKASVTPTPTSAPSPSPTAAASPSPSPAPASGATMSASLAAPVLSVQPSVSPATLDRAGQSIAYAVTVRNSGGQAVRDLAVSAVAQNLHALTCTPTAQGGSLAAGATTVCRGTRTSLPEDLRSHGGPVSATAAGFAPDGTPVSATSSVGLATATAAPLVTDDKVVVSRSTPYVVLPASTNDAPAVDGGPTIDPGRTLLKSPYTTGAPYWKAWNRTWEVLADGSVGFFVRPPTPTSPAGYGDAIQYRTTDSAGQSALGRLTVVVRDGAVAQKDAATTRQGTASFVSVLKNDRAGVKPDGSRATFVEERLRFPAEQPSGIAKLADGGRTVTLPRTGTFRVSGDQLSFSPDPTFVGLATVAYAVTDTLGNVTSSTVTVRVTPVVPTVTDPTAVTTSLKLVDVEWLAHARPGSPGTTVGFGGFVSPDGTNLGTDVTTAQGSWYSPVYVESPRSYVSFYPAPGFAGVATTPFQVVDNLGNRATATLRVTVRRGWSAQPDLARTTAGTDVTLDPLANDVPHQRVDSTPGHFDLRQLRFSDSGQPAGGVLDAGGKTITLPGRGSAWISNGKLTFRPQPGYTGSVGRLSLELRDDSSQGIGYPLDTLIDRVGVIVTSDAPTATDDSATTVLDRPVTLPAATDDDPGSAARPLPTTFPATGQPPGSIVSAGGKVLTVPGQGVWSLDAAGAATFTPERGFVDGATPVAYRIQGAGGTSSVATLSVSVERGPTATPDAIDLQRNELYTTTLDVLANDLPGHDADQTLGTIDPTSVRFPLDGQPAGSVVSGDGRVLTVRVGGGQGQVDIYAADPTTGRVGVQTGVPRLGAVPPVTYEVQDTVLDAGGVEVHHRTTGTLQLTYTGRDPVATDDSATTTQGTYVRLAGATNDVPGSGGIRTDDTPTFPYDQQSSLPPGSYIRYFVDPGHINTWAAFVHGEGTWSVNPFDGSIDFYPAADFVGTTTPLRYHIDDSRGGSDEATLSVTVVGFVPATLRQDVASTDQGVAVTVRPQDNDTAARRTDGTRVPFDPDELRFVHSPETGTMPEGSEDKELVVPGEGRYSLAFGTGVLTFRPDPTFRGTTRPVLLTQQGETSTLEVEVGAVAPVATSDPATTKPGTPVRVAVLANDTAGTSRRPLVPGSVRLRATGLPGGATLSADGQLATLPGRGSFAVAGDGTLTFYPLGTATGAVPAVTYEVADRNGTKTAASVTVRVA